MLPTLAFAIAIALASHGIPASAAVLDAPIPCFLPGHEECCPTEPGPWLANPVGTATECIEERGG